MFLLIFKTTSKKQGIKEKGGEGGGGGGWCVQIVKSIWFSIKRVNRKGVDTQPIKKQCTRLFVSYTRCAQVIKG